MGQPAARLGDMHVCPMVTGVVPHVGGPILPPCCPLVLIGGMPAARVGDMADLRGSPRRDRLGLVYCSDRRAARRAHGRYDCPRRRHCHGFSHGSDRPMRFEEFNDERNRYCDYPL